MRLASRVSFVCSSQTSASRRRAQELAARGERIINLAAGELLDEPPAVVRQALLRLAQEGGTNLYTDTAGVAPLRSAIAARTSARLGSTFGGDQIVVTCGAKQALYLTVMALFGEGDDVLLPTPAWGTFGAQLGLVGARVVPVDTTGNRYLPSIEHLEAAWTPNTRGLVINTPNNPTGAVYGRELIAALTAWAVDHDLWIVIDESYADLVLPPVRHVHPVECQAGAADRIVSIGSFSKSFAVTGWRVGYLYGPEPVVAAAKSLQSHLTSHAPSVLQHALVPAAEGAADDFISATVARIERRLAIVEKGLASLPQVRWEPPSGAFYLFLDCRALLGRTYHGVRVTTTAELTERLLANAGIAVTSGVAFGAEGHVRVSLTADEADLAEALTRLEEFVHHGS